MKNFLWKCTLMVNSQKTTIYVESNTQTGARKYTRRALHLPANYDLTKIETAIHKHNSVYQHKKG